MPVPRAPPNTENRDWWEFKYQDLRRLAAPVHAIDPKIVYGKSAPWPVIKLVWTRWLVDQYLTILNRQRQDEKFDSLHLVDVTAGSGLTGIGVRGTRQSDHVIAGTSVIAADFQRPDKHWFAEPMPRIRATLKKRLNVSLQNRDHYVGGGDRLDEIKAIAEGITSHSARPHYMAIVDQEGYSQVRLDDLAPLFQAGTGRGDVILNVHTRDHNREPERFARFLGRSTWDGSQSPDDALGAVEEKLAEMGRPRAKHWRVRVGGGNDWFYDMVVATADPGSGAPWLDGFESELERRMAGITGATIESFLTTRSLTDFF